MKRLRRKKVTEKKLVIAYLNSNKTQNAEAAKLKDKKTALQATQ